MISIARVACVAILQAMIPTRREDETDTQQFDESEEARIACACLCTKCYGYED